MSESVQRGGIAAGQSVIVFSVATEWMASHSITDVTVWCSIVGLGLTAFTSIPRIVDSCRVLAALSRSLCRKVRPR